MKENKKLINKMLIIDSLVPNSDLTPENTWLHVP